MQDDDQKSVSKDNSSKKSKNDGHKKDDFFKLHVNEFKKISWPSRKTLIKHTITVTVFSLVMSGIIYVYDVGINYLVNGLANIAS